MYIENGRKWIDECKPVQVRWIFVQIALVSMATWSLLDLSTVAFTARASDGSGHLDF